MSDADEEDTMLDKPSSPTSPADTLKRKREDGTSPLIDTQNGAAALHTPPSPTKRLRSQYPTQSQPTELDIAPPAPPPPPPMTPDDTQQAEEEEDAQQNGEDDETGTAFAGKSMADVLASAQQDGGDEDISMTVADNVDDHVSIGSNPLTLNGHTKEET